MDLSKVFDCIPHDLLIAKLFADRFDENSLVFIYSCLSRRDQCVREQCLQFVSAYTFRCSTGIGTWTDD